MSKYAIYEGNEAIMRIDKNCTFTWNTGIGTIDSLALTFVFYRPEQVEDVQDQNNVMFEDSNVDCSQNKQTPIKSWLRKHLNSNVEDSQSLSPPRETPQSAQSSLPQYIIPLVSLNFAPF